ncbi:pyridoxal phosphate-dependent transferase [Sordaria brevicollis]|uniref:Pyridoxal phosphate-dependent transferase n=1 Tax=Sordaria brevicollis TaxID=83679 RepID=A0AAE0PKV2_SORBR|nr:pyridoxal phosphate-dependent transferase [Sordaria brevicollis]
MTERGIIEHPELLKLGESLPPGDPHGVSVHLPTWEDTLGWASRDRRVLDTMVTGYPRFFIPRVVERLAERLLEHFTQTHDHTSNIDLKDKHALIVSTAHHALMCRQFFRQKVDHTSKQETTFPILIAHWNGTITFLREHEDLPQVKNETTPLGQEDIFLLPYPVDMFPVAKAFWQHTGFGISSRRATYWMDSAPFLHPSSQAPPPPFSPSETTTALSAIRTRLANCYSTPSLPVADKDVFLYPTGMSSIAAVSAAVKSLASPQLTGKRQPSVALFGFLYVDTLKLLSTLLGFQFKLFPFSTPLSSLEQSLESKELVIDLLVTEFPGNPLLQSPDLVRLWELSRRFEFALVVDDTVGGTGANVNVLGRCDAVVSSLTKMVSGGCDVMGGCAVLNPSSERYEQLWEELTGSRPDRNSATDLEGEEMQQSGETDGIGDRRAGKRDSGYAEEEPTLASSAKEPYTKSPSQRTITIKNETKQETERSWFPTDITSMDHNSLDFIHRVRKASSNAEWIVQTLLHPHSSVQEVYYPKGSSTEAIYEQFRVKPTSSDSTPAAGDEDHEGGYGYLVSIKFQTPAKARAFYDALDVAKGPSLGTNFTLCCAYTLLAHYRELEWAAEFGVVEDLVRISVGLEEKGWLGERVGRALEAAGRCEA